jgi:hypothetical protein
MERDETQNPRKWKSRLEAAWRDIPKPYRNDHSVRRTLQCCLYGLLREAGYTVVADYMPPRIADRTIDLIALNGEKEIVHAFCLDTLVTLAAVKSLGSFPSTSKTIFTTGMLEKKVNESRFFLKPEIEHIHLQPFGKSPLEGGLQI